ncbi:MAG: DUF2341 domain-containing protein [Candidatus Thermoplasmatota archaeon]|nr:DUF2341 domain-containing protein [Candidatus Thermoplasmatota archaeon]MDH7506259.1 DUF2341 domain-containing protein [Candidatus Thermoplasmatota archaeon]
MAFPEGWTKQKAITLGGSVDGELTEHQSETLVIDWEEDMLEDFGDIRFYLDDETTEIPYLLESYESGVSAVFKVKPDTLPEIGLNLIIIFGNPEATTTSENPEDFYEFYDGCTGTFADKWDISDDGNGSQGYDTVDGRNAIKISNSGDHCLIVTKDFELSKPFKIECGIYVADYIAFINYLLPNPVPYPYEGVAYRARIDTRYGEDELLDVDGVAFGDEIDVTGDQSVWFDTVLTLDQNDDHVWQIDDLTPVTGNDDTYESGHLAFESTWDGYTAFSNVRVSKFTTNQPVWGELGETEDIYPKQTSRFRSRFKVVEEAVARFRSHFWLSPERVRFRSKILVYEQKYVRFRSRLRIKGDVIYTADRDRFRSTISLTAKEKVRFRSIVRIKTGKTRLELFARVKLRTSETEDDLPDFTILIGDQLYDS